MILCVTPNPAVDHTLVIPGFTPGVTYRASPILTASGKGLNVARAVRTLGAPVRCAGFLGGMTGRLLEQLAESEGVSGRWTWIAGETRVCTLVVDPKSRPTVLNEPGPGVTGAEWARFEEDVLAEARQAEITCWSGSLLAGSPLHNYTQLLERIVGLGKPLWVDTSGAPLRAALDAPGIGIKVNRDEAGAALGLEIATPQQACQAAGMILERGMAAVVITLEADGAILRDAAGCWQAVIPPLPVVSAIASGDCFLAGLATAQRQGLPLPECLRRAVAAGAANTLSPGSARFTMQEFEDALKATRLERLE